MRREVELDIKVMDLYGFVSVSVIESSRKSNVEEKKEDFPCPAVTLKVCAKLLSPRMVRTQTVIPHISKHVDLFLRTVN